MKTESSKFRGRRISHNLNDYNVPTQADWEAAYNSGSGTTITSQSGKFSGAEWSSMINTGVNALGNVLGNLFGKGTTSTTYVTNTTDTKKDNTALYVGIGAGALVLILLLVVILKK